MVPGRPAPDRQHWPSCNTSSSMCSGPSRSAASASSGSGSPTSWGSSRASPSPPPSSRRPRGGHDLRRVRDRGVQPGPGSPTCSPCPDPEHVRDRAMAGRGGARRPDVLRHPAPRPASRSRRPPLRAEAQRWSGPGRRASPSTSARRWSSSTSGPPAEPEPLDQRRLLRPDRSRHGVRAAQADDPDPRGHGHPGRVQLPRARPEPARDRPPLHRRAHHGRQRHDVPHGGEGGRPRPGRLRHVHAEADRRLRSARGCTRTSRCSRATSTRSTTRATSTACRRWAKGFIAGLLRHAREITAVTNQTVNSYKRLIAGYEAPVYICWARNNRSALVRVPIARRGQGELDPDRVPLARPGVQPVPRVLA